MLGILGGTFDPIHFGHLRTALDVQQALMLDELRFIPLRDPPHREQPLSTPAQRLAMLQAAIADQPGFCVDERELKREGKSYTVETLRSLRAELGDTPLCLILGSDAFRGFPGWHQPREILQLTHLVVMRRPGEAEPHAASLQAFIQGRKANSPATLHETPAGRILFQTVTQLDISATGIRTLIRQGRSPRYLVPDATLQIIEREGLYR